MLTCPSLLTSALHSAPFVPRFAQQLTLNPAMLTVPISIDIAFELQLVQLSLHVFKLRWHKRLPNAVG